jgi:hypothetical protein
MPCIEVHHMSAIRKFELSVDQGSVTSRPTSFDELQCSFDHIRHS